MADKSNISLLNQANYATTDNLNSTMISSNASLLLNIGCPIILAVGTFGNIMTLVILWRLGFGITNLFLRALAICDLFILYFGLLTLWLGKRFNFHFENAHGLTCKLSYYLGYSSSVLSAWLVVAMTVQRSFSVVWPHRVKAACTRRKIFLVMRCIAIISLVLHTHMLYGFGLKSDSNVTNPTCNLLTTNYAKFMSNIWSWVDLLCFSFLPFIFLVISNIALVWKLKKSMKTLTLIFGESAETRIRKRKASSITRTVVAVSIIFLLLTLPKAIYLILWPYVFLERYGNDEQFRGFVDLMNDITTLLWYSSYAINFFIYCLTGKKFRAAIKLMCFARVQNTHNGIELVTISNSGSSQNIDESSVHL